MNTTHTYVIDTVGFINYFNQFFREEPRMSRNTRLLLDKCFDYYNNQYKISIPSIVFVEVYDKFLKSEERALGFKYEVFEPLLNMPDVQIQAIDKEVMKSFIDLSMTVVDFELHDKIILSSALTLKCPIITCDPDIKEYIRLTKCDIDVLF